MFLLLSAAISSVAVRARAEPTGGTIEIRLRLPDGGRRTLARVELDRLPQVEAHRVDPQYGAEVWARGLPLAEVLAQIAVPSGIDLMLLRFNNGLLIPLSFRDRPTLERLRPFLARAVATPGPFARLVPGGIAEPRRPPTPEDLRPIHFQGNKIIVADPRHADVLPKLAAELQPWLYADSLAEIELCNRAAWERQLAIDPATEEGQRVFLGSCRFCHAVRGVGGALGWDFVDPVPIYSDEWNRRMAAGTPERNPTPGRTMLGIHVRYRADGGGNRTMPALRSMSAEQVKALWAFIQSAAAKPLRAYAP